MARLKGAELLAFVEERKGVERDEVIAGAGYVSTRGGKQSLQRTKFFEAMMAANGHQLGPAPAKAATNAGGKAATYRLRVGPSGLIPVSRAYTAQCGMEPSSYVTVVIEDGVIVLEPEGDVPGGASDAEPTAAEQPPAATLASVA